MKQEWTPFQEADDGLTPEQRKRLYGDERTKVYLNSRYQVNVTEFHDQYPPGWPQDPVLCLSIKRRDKMAIHDWRDLQRIKNELVGPERLAVEIYPPESCLVDTANQFFIWVMPEGFKENVFPFMFQGRLVVEESGGGSRQRPWPKDSRPTDLTSHAEWVRRFGEMK